VDRIAARILFKVPAGRFRDASKVFINVFSEHRCLSQPNCRLPDFTFFHAAMPYKKLQFKYYASARRAAASA